jgi:predicted transglutaminase-like cysteine proteinase
MNLKLQALNDKINYRISYVEDFAGWGAKDYWATPSETLNKGTGDCEDIAILKYSMLKKMGWTADSMRILYVVYAPTSIFHVVLECDGFILDNIVPEVLPVAERQDLQYVFGFNEHGVWVNDKKVGGVEKLKPWADLLDRIGTEI